MSLLYYYVALFAWSFLAATLVPMSSEAYLAYLVWAEGAVVLPVLVGTAGNVLGACTTYWISRRAAEALVEPNKKAARGLALASRMLERYGQPVLLLSWVPIIGDALVALAGAAGLRFGVFCFWMALGKGLRYLAVALVALNLL